MTDPSNPTAAPVERSATPKASTSTRHPPNGASLPHSLAGSASPSARASPVSSRDASPARMSHRQRVASAVTASHKSEVSPQRPPSLPGNATTVPSAAAIQRALSATNAPQLQPSAPSDSASKLPRAQRSGAAGGSEDNAPYLPTSPRLRSPPPSASNSRRNSLRNQKQPDAASAAPSIVVQSSTPTSASQLSERDNGSIASLDEMVAPQPRKERNNSGLPALATVEEGSVPSTPSTEIGEDQALSKQTTGDKPKHDPASTDNSDLSSSDIIMKRNESGSDSASKKSKEKAKKKRAEDDPDKTPRPKAVQPKTSYTSLASIKQKAAAETASRKMTVETETVSSTGQPTLGGASGDRKQGDNNGSLRLRPSHETIRPKKERKKSRKAPSINSGTASSKADVFEAKVASAVDDVNSSDSDETFVYESNPPESQPRRSRHHSRTPSTTSMASMADPRTGMRSLTTALNAERGVSGKRSMKFANNPYSSSGADDDSVDRPDGTFRGGPVRPTAGNSVHHHHISRHNRAGLAPTSAFTEDSPFTQASKRSGTFSTNSSRPTSPRIAHARATAHGNGNGNGNGTTRKNEMFASYDLDADGADDERTPLIGTVRTPRGVRRVPTNLRQRYMERAERSRSYWLSRCVGCGVMIIMIAAVVLGAIGFFFVTTKPLYEVDVKEIRNVLASEQEIMMDLMVEAINPNLMTISVAAMDVNVFAKSKHVGSEKWWRDHGKPPPRTEHRVDRRGRQEEATLEARSKHWVDTEDFGFDWPDVDDPDEVPEGDPQMMLLGRVLQFDNALMFDGSPIKRHLHYSVGELRVPHPGNKTEAGGTERWERVLQDKFQLIVRGILKYSLPLSTHVIAAPIDASVEVFPDKGVDDHGRMVVGRTKSRKHPDGGEASGREKSPFIGHEGHRVVWHGQEQGAEKGEAKKKEGDAHESSEPQRHFVRSARFVNVEAPA